MKKIILIGETGAGKTTLTQWLQNKEMRYKKTQQVIYSDDSIDTPGEFMENRGLYNALVSSSVDADLVVFVQSAVTTQTVFPPFFSGRFTKPVIGVVTKIDLVEEKMIRKAEWYLKSAGAKRCFPVSFETKLGLKELAQYLA